MNFFVSKDGNDQWSGTLDSPAAADGPFASLERARDTIRKLNLERKLNQPVEVQVREGTYYLAEPLQFWGADSGTEQCPITYMAYPGETPVLSGGRRIKDWQPFRENIVSAHLPEVNEGRWWFRQLFFNGKRMIRSRCPSYDSSDPLYGGWAFITAVDDPVTFGFDQDDFPHVWEKLLQTEVFIIPGKSWISDIIPVKSVDYDNCKIHLTRPVLGRYTLESATTILAGNRFYVENALEDLNQPGEWCLDTESGTLYFWPPEGTLESSDVIAPAVVRLIQMMGTPEAPVRHLRIQGFTFRHTQAQYPTPETYYKTPNAGQTLYMENTEDCSIENNFFDAVGGDAIRLQNSNTRNRIAGNEIAGAGAYGIFLGSFQKGFCLGDPTSGDIPSPPQWYERPEDHEAVVHALPRSANHVIHNNHIHHMGVFEKHACGVAFFGISAVDVVVSNNLIHHSPRFGIGLMSGFGSVTIENNEMHDLSLETCDTGGITSNRWYTYDKDPDLSRGNIIRFNSIRDVIGCGAYEKKAEPGGGEKAGGRIWTPYYSWAIYFDNGPINVLVYGNLCARNTLGGIMISHYAQNITVENNIFVDSGQSQVYLALAGDTADVHFRKNIIAYKSPNAEFMRLNISPDVDVSAIVREFDRNLYFNADDSELNFSGLPGEAEADHSETLWRRMGYDEHSLKADPKFVYAANDNYELAPDSPAFDLGFQPVDFRRIGLVSEDDQ